MNKPQRKYSPEFRQQIVELVQSGKKPGELSREFGCHVSSIHTWVNEASMGSNPAAALHKTLNHEEREELERLRKEVRQLKTERDILSKATAWFASNSAASTSFTR